jgi:hypothetical protein
MTTPKYGGSSIAEQLRTVAHDAAYSDRPFDVIAAAEEIGRALSGTEREAALECYRLARAEMRIDREEYESQNDPRSGDDDITADERYEDEYP